MLGEPVSSGRARAYESAHQNSGGASHQAADQHSACRAPTLFESVVAVMS